ncbi:hypothetical protein EDB92DRAFT_1902525 [Lactarius akahatsu]|uniref:Uncharacterized protein n=1 Tax=Lactarius akahatsu TaxID=416441 RepID=A0AAD4L667_9AGAM|nr:hypothetical protein EDB92DRAFT_1902525 [Lactarius akahatsu]
MADFDPSWNVVPLSDSSAVSFVGNWSAYTPSGFRNVSHPETIASVAFSFHGTAARVVGFVSFGPLYDPLQGRITWGSEERVFDIPSFSGDTRCIGDGPSSLYNLSGTETCPPPTFYSVESLLCNQYTLNLTVSPDQAMRLKQFEFLPCTSDGDPASASTTALASASSSASAIATEKKQTLSAGVIAGAALGALIALLALGSLAFLIILRRRRRRIGTLPSPSSPPPSPSPFLICFSRSRSWLRQPGRHPKPTNPSAEFLTSSSSSSSPAAASRGDSRTVQGYYPTTTMMIDASGSTPPSTVLPLMGPWSSARSAGNARDGGTAFEKQQEPEPSGLPVAHGYLPDSKELMAWQEREQAGAQGLARTPSTTEVLPLYQTRRSLRRPS